MDRPEIVTICTSYKFKDDILPVFKQLTDGGIIVLLPAFLGDTHSKEWYLTLHKKKIDISDSIVVIRANEYYGESVTEEIAYAISQNKHVYYAVVLKDTPGLYQFWQFI